MPRSYRQFCSLARALDVVGDRWNILIIRNLLLGPQTWSELRNGLPGIAKNLLSDRLTDLTETDVIEHANGLYQLTNRGRELETVLFSLASWGERHFFDAPRPDDAIRVRYLMTSIKRKLSPVGPTRSFTLKINDAEFTIALGDEPTVRDGPARSAPQLSASIEGLRAFLFMGARWDDLVAEGLADGPFVLANEFRDAYRSP